MINRASYGRASLHNRGNKKGKNAIRKAVKVESSKLIKVELSQLLDADANPVADIRHPETNVSPRVNHTQENHTQSPKWRKIITGHPCGLIGFGLSSIGVGIYASSIYQQVYHYSEENKFRIIVQTFIAIFIMSISALMIGLSDLSQKHNDTTSANTKDL
ncbi:putative membrane protein [Candidatus Ichthyocystis hellenicum]|uniref:Putative membrane protein n=2 Tax=Candidatus Ichthyocystis TaxID=2929841 RepID=A0A0S4M2X9_9BURK|nr:hypothetical protein [Candidatus Ichthyocystis hellenicum]CUT18131.1 putative membrane protein [Candidatus Ichthyocystis hellenicum]